MAKKQTSAGTKMVGSRCEITGDNRRRLATERQTEEIRENFPAGIARPALRALYAAGFRTLRDLTRISEAELAELHGMGPTAVKKLKDALAEGEWSFRQ